MDMYRCPVCGKGLTRHGEPYDTPQQVVSHIDEASDTKHDGETGEDYMDEIRENKTEIDPIERDHQHPTDPGSAAPLLEQTTITAHIADDDEISVKVFLERVDESLDRLQTTDQQVREDIQLIEEELISLRDSVDALEHDLSRVLWYIELMAREEENQVILDDMEQEGHL